MGFTNEHVPILIDMARDETLREMNDQIILNTIKVNLKM